MTTNTLSILSEITTEELIHYLTLLTESMIIERTNIDHFKLTSNSSIKYITNRTSRGRAINIHTIILEHLEYMASTDYERLANHFVSLF